MRERVESAYITSEFDPICVAAEILRGFALTGQDLVNPVTGFNDEFEASSDGSHRLYPSSRMSRMSYERFDYEKSCAELAARWLWQGEPTRSAEEVLVRLIEVEGLLDPADDALDDGFDPNRAALKAARITPDGCVRRPWDVFGITRAFVDSNHFMRGNKAVVHTRESEAIMGRKDESAIIVQHGCERMFAGQTVIVNPLVRQRWADDKGTFAYGSACRAKVLADLQGLSHRIWHLCTCVSIDVLLARLMRQEDGGLADLELLDSYADLLGAEHLEDRHPRTVDGMGKRKGQATESAPDDLPKKVTGQQTEEAPY